MLPSLPPSSLYLYLKHPDVAVGDLVKKRQDLVKNHFLQQLAKKVDIQDYLLFNRKTNLPQSSFLHYGGNCIETILGAVFLDGGETEAKKLFGRLAFSEASSVYSTCSMVVCSLAIARPTYLIPAALDVLAIVRLSSVLTGLIQI